MRTDDHVDMAGHDTPSIYFKSFILLAMLPAFDHDLLVLVADKKIDPVYNSKTYKVKFVLVVEFILSAHGGLKIRQLNPQCKKRGKISRRDTYQRGTC